MLKRRNALLLLLWLLATLVCIPAVQAATTPSTLFHAYMPVVRKSGERRETGTGKSLPFQAGEPVIGSAIDLTDGQHYEGCYLASPRSNGTVTDGVVWPFPEEVASATPCQVPDNTRRESGPGKTIEFFPNEPVIASVISINNDTYDRYEGCYLANNPYGGTITDGVVWPNPEEIAAASVCGNPVNARRETGPGNSLPFQVGEPVIGSAIDLADGQHFEGCYLASPGSNGTVTDGVVWPYQAEIDAAQPCQ